VKSFLQIAKHNEWILLTGTPGDTWLDYAPVFIANGWYKNITEFREKHVVFDTWSKFPKVKRYLAEHRLNMLRNEILVEMPLLKHTKPYINWTEVDYDKDLFDLVYVNRWNPYENRPIRDISEMFRLMRKVVNGHASRVAMVRRIQQSHKKLIVFYNFDFELEALREEFGVYEHLENPDFQLGEWNGHKKEPVPTSNEWVYLVQYMAGAEGWNCVETDAMCFYSLTYSYKNFVQAMGRIDRLNTKFVDLFYYPLVTHSVIDLAIQRSLKSKEAFNERKFVREQGTLAMKAEFF
jgi:superfamily II DNA or RNA helicase